VAADKILDAKFGSLFSSRIKNRLFEITEFRIRVRENPRALSLSSRGANFQAADEKEMAPTI
jgi:hypothetical protein